MKLTQSWVGYLDRSYEQIKRNVLRRLSIKAPEISDHSESNPLIIVLSFFAGIAESLNLNIDGAAKEAFLGTCRRYSSAVRLVKLIDYNIKARNSASADLLFQLVDDNGEPLTNPGPDLIIPLGTIISVPSSTLAFRLLAQVTMPTGLGIVYGSAAEFTQVDDEILGVTDGSALQKIGISSKYVQGSMRLKVDGIDWVEYRSFGLMLPNVKGYIVNIDEDQNAFIQFGDNINGLIPTNALTVTGSYKECEGTSGNLPPDSLTVIVFPEIVTPEGYNLIVTNPDYASAGTDFESLEDIKNRAPRSLRTLERAVTYQDYLDMPLLVPGVGASAVRYCCGKYVDIFISPNSRGIATRALVDEVTDYMDCKVMITTRISVQPSGLSRIWIQAKIYGKPLFTNDEIWAQVTEALDLEFGFINIEINRNVYITDIITTIERLSMVDRIEIEKVKIEPYARPMEATDNILNIEWVALPTTTVKTYYRLIWRNAILKFELYKNTYFIQQLDLDTVFNDGIIAFQVVAGTYIEGDSWEFTAFPSYPEIFPATVIEINDFSSPIVDVGPVVPGENRTIFSNLTIVSQGTSSSCLPPCN